MYCLTPATGIMDKQRQQAYYQLIENLLRCPDGEESEILVANTDLLDAGFWQTLEALAEDFAQQGEENNAGWLRNLATQLGAGLNLNRTIPDLEAEQFLLEVLQATANSNGNAQVVYPLLAANTDKLNDNFAEILRRWAINRLVEVEPETAKYLAPVIGNFSYLINQFPLGNKASNMEIAITGYEIALTIFTRADFPQDWATTQNNLGNAYLERIRGDQAENLEQAIAAYSAALQIYTRADFPQAWATTQNNLGNAYSNRIRGDKAENLEQAITAYSAALQIRTRADFPQDWAMTQNNLGNAYSNRIRGDKADNLEQAITAYSAALEIYTRADFPQAWAMTQNNLGIAYSNRIRGDQAENLEQAIAAYSAALEIRTRADFPQAWATTQNNLGIAYSDRIRGDKAENLEQALAAYSAALQIYTHADFPQDWAMTQNNLGNAYSDRIRGDQAENLEQAIAAYSAALEIYTRADFPQDWATTQNNLGTAYSNRIRGNKAENLEMAISALYAALQIYVQPDLRQKLTIVPNNPDSSNIGTYFQQGIYYQKNKQYILAYISYKHVIHWEEQRQMFLDEEKNHIFSEHWHEPYIKIAETCLGFGRTAEAIQHIESSKTRNLVKLILNNPQFTPIKYLEIKNILDNETVIIQLYIFTDCFRAFIITHTDEKPQVWKSSYENLKKLRTWINNYLQLYYTNKEQWQDDLHNQLIELGKILHIEQIISLVPTYYQKLIFIPHLYLHLLPLHALIVKESYLLDLFPKGVGYAPSCQILQQVHKRQRNDFKSLFAIQTPTQDLDGTDLGAIVAIKQKFKYPRILKKEQANKLAILSTEKKANQEMTNVDLLKANSVFFFCHGNFNFDSPLESSLQLADGNLTLAEIINHLKLENCRLVTLAACETGMIDFTNTSDEYIGLPGGFLLAGSNNVVSSLWVVEAKATALLMIRFYQELQEQHNIVLALNTAQCWLRDTTAKGFLDWLSNSSLTLGWQKRLSRYFAKIATDEGEDVKPFASPYYWSAFCAIGKGV